MYRHRVFGLVIESQIELPELSAEPGGAAPDVIVTLGSVAPIAPDYYRVAEGEVILDCEGAGRYRAEGGRTIVIDPDPGADEGTVRIYLLGSALGAILHQRGLLPLHSNGVVVDGRAVAFAGPPGAGKSTLAAWFHDRGHRLLSDDVCVLEPCEAGFLAHPGVPRLRLWRDALEASGRSAEDYAQAFDGWEKYLVRANLHDAGQPVPLSHIYLLRSGDREEVEIRRLTGTQAVQALVENTYRGSYVRGLGQSERHFRGCVSLATTVPVFEVTRPWSLERLATDASALRAHAQSVARVQMPHHAIAEK